MDGSVLQILKAQNVAKSCEVAFSEAGFLSSTGLARISSSKTLLLMR